MNDFFMWSEQLNRRYTDMVILLTSCFLKLISKVMPQKPTDLQYQTQEKQTPSQDISQIIITMDFEGLLVEHTRFFRKDMTKLNVCVQRTWWEKLQFWREVGYFYKRRPGYDQFVRLLSRIPNTLLFIYTKEKQEIADRLIEQLRLTHYFPVHQRRYQQDCKIFGSFRMKHPAYVDVITARVIILTTDLQSECDDSNESSKYFLEIPFGQDLQGLMKYGSLLSNVILSNKKKEDLHQDLQNRLIRWQYQKKL